MPNRALYLPWIVAVTAILFALPVLNAGFFWDDLLILQGHPAIEESALFAFATPLFQGEILANYYRPLPLFVLGLAGNLVGSEHALAFHAVQLGFVGAFAASLFLLFRQLAPSAWAVGAAFAVIAFPPNMEAFAWISALPDLVLAVFVVAFLTEWKRGSEAEYPSGQLFLFFIGALLSKESAFALLPLIALLDLPRLRKETWRRALRFHAPLWAVFTMYLGLRSLIVPNIPKFEFLPVLWLKTAGAYWMKILNPLPLSVLIERISLAFDYRVIVGGLLIAGLGYAVLRARTFEGRLPPALFLAFLLPHVNIWPPFGENYLIAERYMLMFSVAVVAALLMLVRHLPGRLAPLALAVPLLFWAPVSWQRANAWADERQIWTATANDYPEFANPHLWLAASYANEGDYTRAKERIDRAVRGLALPNQTPNSDVAYSVFTVAQKVAMNLGEYDQALVYARGRYQYRPQLQTAVEGFQIHDRRLDRGAALKALVNAAKTFPKASEFMTFAYGYAVLAGDEAAAGQIQMAAGEISQDAVKAFASDREGLARLSHFERGKALAEMSFFSLAFREFALASTEMTAQQAEEVRSIAAREHFSAAEQVYRKLAQAKLGYPIIEVESTP